MATQREDTDLPCRAPSPTLYRPLSRPLSPRGRFLGVDIAAPRRFAVGDPSLRSSRPSRLSAKCTRPRSRNGHNARAFRGGKSRSLPGRDIARGNARGKGRPDLCRRQEHADRGLCAYPPWIDNARKAGKKEGKEGEKKRNCTPVEAKRVSISVDAGSPHIHIYIYARALSRVIAAR